MGRVNKPAADRFPGLDAIFARRSGGLRTRWFRNALGAVLAVFSTNLKYILACSSLSQIGFITVGASMICLLGEHNALAANGTVLYMMNHSLVKLALFLFAGVVYYNTHALDLNDIKGFGRWRVFRAFWDISARRWCTRRWWNTPT